ncbi:UNVERIFIED_CONTAM: PR domain zinc finger protein 12 [Trichonephila clavipes]
MSSALDFVRQGILVYLHFEQLHVCGICNKSFDQARGLRRNTRIHIKDKPYVCEICKKGFSEMSSLKVHIRIHIKERPYLR